MIPRSIVAGLSKDRTGATGSDGTESGVADVVVPRQSLRVALSATFTADSLEENLRFWLDAMGFAGEIELAPYNQVFQQLLDPSSVLGRNVDGINLVLLRFEDWLRFTPDHDEQHTGVRPAVDGARTSLRLSAPAIAGEEAVVLQRFEELLAALRAYAARCAVPTWLWLGPMASPRLRALYAELEQRLASELRGMGQLALLRNDQAPTVEAIFDARRDELGHIPYTDEYFTALGTVIARRIYAIKASPVKVIAMDCDHTLWDGVVGEDGALGVGLSEGKLALQRALIAQQQQGVLLCLLSKNSEDDVLEVLDQRSDMLLKREHLVGWRVNWSPKAQNIAELAQELSLGLDSFLFIDDNPVECAQMRSAQPAVTTLQVPTDDALPAFVENIWAFDRLYVTDEDRQRTRMYQQNSQRAQLEHQAGSITEFIANLDLEIDIDAPAPEQIARVSQLTQRTNQFNTTTLRRSEAEIQALEASGLQCLRVNVKDRFGDYGLVGVMIFDSDHVSTGTLRVDSMMLSCRVLGRGVEHAMLSHLGKVALHAGASKLEIRFVPSKKNRPALDFLQSLTAARERAQAGSEETLYQLRAMEAASLAYEPGAEASNLLQLARTGGAKIDSNGASANAAQRFDRSAFLQRVASEWREPRTLLQAIEQASTTQRPEIDVAYATPTTIMEVELAALWASLLRLDTVGIHDDFATLGGTSLAAAALFAEIEERYGVRLPMTVILEDCTIARLALRIGMRESQAPQISLKPLRAGRGKTTTNLFLVHDGDGETLLYVNLARRLPPHVSIYGIEPLGTPRVPIRHTRLEDMARHYVQEIKQVQPSGPYLLGGMCAGGVLAFEMALQLEAAGEQIALLSLLDSAHPNTALKPGLSSKRRWQSFMSAAEMASVGERVAAAASKVRNVISYEASRQMTRFSSQTRFRFLRQALDHHSPIPTWLHHLSVRTVYDLAAQEYQPRARLRGAAVLFRATEGTGGDEPFVQVYQDPLLGWSEHVEGTVAVHEVPGGHASMLQEPHVKVMSERMSELLADPTRLRNREKSAINPA